jgi:hypothetical protein
MKKTIIIGCIFASFILMMSPCISALNLNTLKKIKSDLSQDIENMDKDDLKDFLKDKFGGLTLAGYLLVLFHIFWAIKAKQEEKPALAVFYILTTFVILFSTSLFREPSSV